MVVLQVLQTGYYSGGFTNSHVRAFLTFITSHSFSLSELLVEIDYEYILNSNLASEMYNTELFLYTRLNIYLLNGSCLTLQIKENTSCKEPAKQQ